ncbi:MAG: hypothetical protein RI637_04990 [Acidimicrobiia bacterium]|nr:hypothetical protein [Acidimicrobiia bacterium]
MVVGAVALAAVGGVAANLPGQAPAATPPTIQPMAPGGGPAVLVAGEDPTHERLIEQVLLYATEVEAWGECVSAAARIHSGEAFDPAEACGESPKAAAHGLGGDRSNPEDRAAKADETAAQKAAQADDEADDPPNKPDKPAKPDMPEKAERPVGDDPEGDG